MFGGACPRRASAPSRRTNWIYMAGIDGVAALGCEMRRRLVADANLCMARKDWRSGFFQLPLNETSSKLLCAAAWDPDLGGRIFRPRKVFFGGAGGPPQFCRVATAVLHIAAELFLIPSVPHVDDNIIIEAVEAMQSARQAIVFLHDSIGFELAADKAAPSRVDASGGTLLLQAIGASVQRGVA
jgi:hypothetical protein